MSSPQAVAVYGATGHTGRFIVAELVAGGFTPIVSGRDRVRLDELAEGWPGAIVRPATVDDPASLDGALAGSVAVINAAGPFAVTGGPVVEAALRARIPYVDVAAEIEANAAMFETYADVAREAGVAVVPAMAFFGGLGDLLATAAMGEWTSADSVHVAYGLSSWRPTAGHPRGRQGVPRSARGEAGALHPRRPRLLRGPDHRAGLAVPGTLRSPPDGRRLHDGRRHHGAEPPGGAGGAHLHGRRGGQRPQPCRDAGTGGGRLVGPLRPDVRGRRGGHGRRGRAASDRYWSGHLRDHRTAGG